MGSNRSYEDLHVWHKAVDLVKHIYRMTSKFPKEKFETYNSQPATQSSELGTRNS